MSMPEQPVLDLYLLCFVCGPVKIYEYKSLQKRLQAKQIISSTIVPDRKKRNNIAWFPFSLLLCEIIDYQ